jgi:hypothetical protein
VVSKVSEDKLRIISKSCKLRRVRTEIQGEVENTSSESLSQVVAMATFRDIHGKIIDTQIGPVDSLPLHPSTKSTFSASSNLKNIRYCEVYFKKIGGASISHSDTGSKRIEIDPMPDLTGAIEYSISKNICGVSKCGGFQFNIVKQGQTNGNPAKIYEVKYKEVIAGDYSKKFDRCSLVHVAFDLDFKKPVDMVASFTRKSKKCSENQPCYACGKVTFKERLKKLGFDSVAHH